MERFLQRIGCAEDQVIVSFARLIGDQFFAQKKDILVNDENAEYRAPLIAALAGKWLEASAQEGMEHPRVLLLAEKGEVLAQLRGLLEQAGIESTICVSKEETESSAERLATASFVGISADLFMTAVLEQSFKPREFGLVIIEGADLFGELPSELQRKVWGYLLPPWERRAVLFAQRLGVRAKNTAIDFANSPGTVTLKKARASLDAISAEFYRVLSEEKFKALLSHLAAAGAQGHHAAIVFCNLRQTSREVEARLRLNHIPAEHVSAAAPPAKNEMLFQRFAKLQEIGDQQENREQGAEPLESPENLESAHMQLVLVVSNDNLEALPDELALFAIHYDIPLDADIYLERVRAMRSRGASMLGLVCERYEVGLSAIESRFGIRVECKEATDMANIKDASEGVPLDLERGHVTKRADFPQQTGVPETRVSERRAPETRAPAARPDRPRSIQERKMHTRISERGKFERKKTDRKKGRQQPTRAGSKNSDRNPSLYSMSTEERLAYFRNKYRGILKTPSSEASPAPQHGAQVSPPDSTNPENGGIVKRLIGKFFSGGKAAE